MKKYKELPVVILKTRTGFSAHSPALDGCVVTGRTIGKTLSVFKEAVEFHLEGEQLVKNHIKSPIPALRKSFSNYGTDAFYATISVPAA